MPKRKKLIEVAPRKKTTTLSKRGKINEVEKPEDSQTTRKPFFEVNFLTAEQRLAWDAYNNNDIVFFIGPAGSGKTFLSVSFALYEIFKTEVRKKLIVSRPLVEAGESMGFLPGGIDEKVYPFMLPIYDSLERLCGGDEIKKQGIMKNRVELAPLGFCRGRTFIDSVCILDEAQNCTRSQMKLFLTRIGHGSKMVITGDPTQSDLGHKSELMNIVNSLRGVPGVGIIEFTEESIVRHPIIAAILSKF